MNRREMETGVVTVMQEKRKWEKKTEGCDFIQQSETFNFLISVNRLSADGFTEPPLLPNGFLEKRNPQGVIVFSRVRLFASFYFLVIFQ